MKGCLGSQIQGIGESPYQLKRRNALAIPTSVILSQLIPAAPSHSILQPPVTVDAETIYAHYPYVHPSDILPFIRDHSTRGSPESILKAIDLFCSAYPQYRSGPIKGSILESHVIKAKPEVALEMGTFVGYGSIRIARSLPPNGRLLTIEGNKEQAAVAMEVINYSGLSEKVDVVVGLSSEVLPTLLKRDEYDFVFLDHCKQCYLPDLELLESSNALKHGSLILADNVLIPTRLIDYLAHVQRSDLYSRTELIPAAFEVEDPWHSETNPPLDAMALSIYK